MYLDGLQIYCKMIHGPYNIKFSTMSTKIHQLSVSWTTVIQFTLSLPITLRSILILSIHLYLRLPSGLLSSDLLTRTLYATPLSPTRSTCHNPSNSSWFGHLDNTCLVERILHLIILRFSTITCFRVPIRPQHVPQRPISEHPQPAFSPQRYRPTATAT